MTGRRSGFFISLFLSLLLICSFRIDRDIYAYENFDVAPNRTNTEQLYSGKTVFDNSFSGFTDDSKIPEYQRTFYPPFHDHRLFFFLSFGHFHSLQIPGVLPPSPVNKILLVVSKKNISHQSSDDEVLN